MNIVMPMAGRGSRFNGSNYSAPKPLINVMDKPMFIHSLQSIKNVEFDQLIIVALSEHDKNFNLKKLIDQYLTDVPVELVLIDEVTEGQLCTILKARYLFDLKKPILITSSDTIVISDLASDIKNLSNDISGLISVADMPGEQWSFAKTDEQGIVIEVTEKVKISDNASTGLYYFSHAGEFLTHADELIEKRERTKGEFYVMPVYKNYIKNQKKIKLSNATKMWDMGTPDALAEFLLINDKQNL